MPITYANSELVARAWLLAQPGIPANKVGTTLPQDVTTWSSTGFVQIIVTGGSPNLYYGYRRPVITAHCWAINPNQQTPPWGKAADLAEAIVQACHTENGRENLSLGVSGAAWILKEPKRIPWGFPSGQGSFIDPGEAAHFTVDFQIAWAEL
jgi:hypothetical protein